MIGTGATTLLTCSELFSQACSPSVSMFSRNLIRCTLVPLRLGGSALSCSRLKFSNAKTKSIVNAYVDMKNYLEVVRYEPEKLQTPLKVELNESTLYEALQDVWKPVCVGGKLPAKTVATVDLVRLITFDELEDGQIGAKHEHEFYCTGTIINTFWVDENKMASIASACNFQKLGVKCGGARLTTYDNRNTDGDSLDYYKRDEGTIGTLVVVLNSPYTCGELEVTYGGHTETVTGAGSWIAFSNDCHLKMNCVATGSRKLLIYDLVDANHTMSGGSSADVESDERTCDSDSETESSDISDHAGTDSDTDYDSSDCSSDEHSDYDEYEYENSLDRKPVKLTPWHNCQLKPLPTAIFHNTHLEENVHSSVRKAAHSELQIRSNIVIALDNVYPECQTSPAFLRGGDRALYDLLSENFDVQVVAATVCTDNTTARAALFSPEIVQRTLAAPDKEGGKCKSKLILPNKLRKDQVIDEEGDIVYVVSGLRVSEKK